MAASVRFILFNYGGGCVQSNCPEAVRLEKALQGVEMTLMAPGTIIGKYAGMELSGSCPQVTPVLKLQTAKGPQAVPVSMIQKLQIADAKLQEELQAMVNALLVRPAESKVVVFGCLDRHGQPPVLGGLSGDSFQAQSTTACCQGAGQAKTSTLHRPGDCPPIILLPIPKCPIEFEHVFRIDMQKPSAPAANALYIISDLLQPAAGCELVVHESGQLAGRVQAAELPADACCLITYSIANDTKVDVAPLSETKVIQVAIEGGKLQLRRAKVTGAKFVITNESNENMPFFAECPRTAGRRLVEPQEWEDRTDSQWRFRFHVYKEATRTMAVREEEIGESETLDLHKAPAETIQSLAEDKNVSKPVRDALAKTLQLRSAGDATKLAKYLTALNIE